MGPVRKGVEPAVDGLLDYVPREKSWLGNVVNLDKTKGTVGPLPQSEYAVEPPWRRIPEEAFVGESDDFGSAEEECHPRSLMPVRVPIPPGLESLWSIGQKAGLLMATSIGAAAGVVGCLWTFAPTIPQNELAENRAKIIVAVPVSERDQAAVLAKSGLSGESAQRSARVTPELPATSGALDPQVARPLVTPQFEEPMLRDPQVARRPVIGAESVGQAEGAASRDRHNLSSSAERPQRKLDAAQIALMLKTGTELLANGSIGAARMMFQSAAEAGDPVAAFALAETYDPVVLAKMGVKGGISPDIILARKWYAKAKDLGSTVAPERLARLER